MSMRDFKAMGFVVTFSLLASPSFAVEDAGVSADAEAASAPLYAVTPPRDFADVKLATATTIGSQSVAVNPKNANVFLAAYANQGSCWVRTSTNTGQTWAAARKLPMPQGKPNCANPAVIWAPDGSRVYAAYSYLIRDVFDTPQEAGAVVSSSNDKGFTWSSPKIALRYPEDYYIISLKLATPLSGSDAKWVYLLSEIVNPNAIHTYFTRSADQGQTWRPEQNLIASLFSSGDASRPSIAGGLGGGEVLVAWGEYHYDFDGNLIDRQIYVKHSNDYGGTFSADVGAVPDTFGDTAVAFGRGGTAHLVYDREWYGDNLYNGKPSYVYSTKAPYTAWSSPVVLSDDISSSAYYSPALTVSACGSGASVLHAVWMDDRLGTDKFNVFYTRKVAKTGETWSPNLRISGTAMPPDYWLSAGIAAGVGTAVGLWGHRDPYSNSASRPVWASRIAPGVSYP